MIKRYLSTTAFALLLSTSLVHAKDIGSKVDTACPFGDCAAGITFSYLGEFIIPTGQIVDSTEFGGISGLDFDASTGRYIAISDDRSERGPVRFYELDIDVSAGGLKGVTVGKHVVLKDTNQEAFAAGAVDPEAVRIGKDGFYWSSEGDAKALVAPFIRIASPDGAFLREFTLPEGFAPTADQSTGIRDNLAFEGLAISPSGAIFAGVEAALYQDGPIASLTNGTLARIVRYDAADSEPKAQYIYPVSVIPQAPTKADGPRDNGMSEMVAIDDRHLLAVERSYAQGYGNNIKLFMIDLDGATDVSGIDSLASSAEQAVPVRKSQVLDLRAFGLTPDNIEAMAIGKATDGTDVLILAADNNFSGRQKSQFYAFEIKRHSK